MTGPVVLSAKSYRQCVPFREKFPIHLPSVPQTHFKFCLKSNTIALPASVPTQMRPFAANTVGEPKLSVPSRETAFWENNNSPTVFKCVHRKTSRGSEVTGLLPFRPLRGRLVVEDDLDNAEKCDGVSERPSGACENSVPTLADDVTRDACGVVERSREMVGWRKGRENRLGVLLPLLSESFGGDGTPETAIGGVGGVDGVSSEAGPTR